MPDSVVSVTVNGTTRDGPRSSRARRSPTSCARTAVSPAPTSGASTACAGRAPCSSTARRCGRASCSPSRPRRPRSRRSRAVAGPTASSRGAAGVPRGPRAAVRLLHARVRGVGHGVPARPPRSRRTTRSATRLSGNLCRCTGYQGIVKAVRLAAASGGRRDDRGDAGRDPVRRPARPRREDARLLTGRGTYVDDVSCPACSTPRSCAATWRAARSSSIDVDGGPRRCDGVVAVFTGRRPQPAGPARAGSTTRGRPAARRCTGCSPRATCASSASRWPSSSPSRATSPRTPPSSIEVDIDRCRPSSASTPPSPTARRSSTASSAATSPATVPARRRPRARRDLRRRRPRGHRDVRPAPLPLRADGDAGHRLAVGPGRPRARRCGSRRRDRTACGGSSPRALGVPENKIRVIMNDVGGGFGQKMFMLPDEVAVVIAGRGSAGRSSGSRTVART